MNLLSKLIIGFIAVLHIYILWLEMFAWTTRGPKAFNKTVEEMESSKILAANQGLYNGFLSAGLIWSLLITDAAWSVNVAYFFLGCVIIAGVYGAASVQKSIFFIQALPAIAAFVVTLLV